MRVSELAHAAGVTVATVKYYIREGLLPAGRKEAARLAGYDEGHLERLRLLRVLREVGGIPVSRLRDLVAAVDDPRLTVHQVFGRAADATAPPASAPGPEHERAAALAAELVEAAGWTDVRQEAADRAALTSVLEVLADVAPAAMSVPALSPYLRAADRIGRHDLRTLHVSKDRSALLYDMVVGQAVFGRLLTVLRRLAEEHHSAQRFGDRT